MRKAVRSSMAVVLALATAGCGSSGATKKPVAQKTTGLTDARLKSALLTSYGTLTPTADPQVGRFGSLPITPTSLDVRDIPSGVRIEPGQCRAALWNGPDPRAFRTASTAFIQFGDAKAASSGRPGVYAWDILLATGGQPGTAALGSPAPGCTRVSATYNGETMTYQEKPAPKIGLASRAAFLRSSDPKFPAPWIVVYTGTGYAGMVVLEGPATQEQVTAFATQAYEKASRTLG
jgi:predicted small lipoprotein YifL